MHAHYKIICRSLSNKDVVLLIHYKLLFFVNNISQSAFVYHSYNSNWCLHIILHVMSFSCVFLNVTLTIISHGGSSNNYDKAKILLVIFSIHCWICKILECHVQKKSTFLFFLLMVIFFPDCLSILMFFRYVSTYILRRD